jgi:putative DNA primase/helicase
MSPDKHMTVEEPAASIDGVDALKAHVTMIHQLAAPLTDKGMLIVASYGQDPATGTDLQPKVEQIAIGDVAGMVAAIRSMAEEPHRNVYISLTVMRADLAARQKGYEADIVGVLGLVADFDDAEAADYTRRLPVTAPYVLETSEGRFQAFLLFDHPVKLIEAKPVASALKRAANCDHGTADMSHVWRVPGTKNWPNRKKVIKQGRSPEPQMVRVVKPWGGSTISLDDLRKAVPVQQSTTNGAAFDFSAHAADYSELPDGFVSLMAESLPEGQRSERAHAVIAGLAERRWSDDAIFAEIQKYPNGVGERYLRRDKALRDDIARIRTKAKGDRRKWSGRQHQGQQQDHNTSRSKTPPEEWPDPLPLIAPGEEPQPYPIDALPPLLRDACIAYQAFGQQPMALVGCSALAAASLATQGHADVERDRGLVGPISLNVLVVAQSGERKTSADKRMSQPIRAWMLEKKQAMKPEVDAARAKIAAFQAEKEGLLAKIKQAAGKSSSKVETADRDKLKYDLEVLETREPVEPVVPVLFYEDVTPEKMAEDMAVGWPSASLWSDEAGLVVGGHGMSESSLLRYLALINRFWDGQSFSRKRSTTKSVDVTGRRLTACLMMQETILAQLLAAGAGVSRGSGFMARFLMAWPVSTMGGRFYRPGNPDDPALVAYDARLRALLDRPLPVDGDGMVLAPPILPLSAAARATWIRFHDDVERELARQGEFADVTDFAAKTADNAARIAGVFHVLEHGPDGEIKDDTMLAAIDLALWHLHDAKRIIGAIEIPTAVVDARRLLEWLLAQGDDVTPREISYRGPGPLRERVRRDAAIDVLTETSHVVRAKVGRTGEILTLNPKLRGAQ